MLTYIQPIYIFILALILAILEVQIEGAHGWAKNLPTWRANPHKWYAKLYMKMMEGKEMTGYHLSLFSMIFLLFHFPYASGLSWTISNEISTIIFFLFFIVVEDYLWFVVNPYFTVKDFKGNHLFWHQKWFLKLPRDYWTAFILSATLALLKNNLYYPRFMQNWAIAVGILLILTVLTKEFIKKFKPEWE
jgi:hypothetical protein